MHIVFVCTGNICRSPFAEALGPHVDPQHTYTSAGTRGLVGEPASAPGVAVANEHFDVDLGGHRAVQLSPTVLDGADLVFAMEQAHAEEALRLAPAARVELLSPDGGPIPDPYGGDEAAYLVTYTLIKRSLDLRLGPTNQNT